MTSSIEKAIVGVYPTPYLPNDAIHVYISYQLWQDPRTAEAVRAAIEAAFNDQDKQISPPRTIPPGHQVDPKSVPDPAIGRPPTKGSK